MSIPTATPITTSTPTSSPPSSSFLSQQMIPTLVRAWIRVESQLSPTLRQQAATAFSHVHAWVGTQFTAHPSLLPITITIVLFSLLMITFVSSLILLLIWPFLLTGAGVTLFNVLSASILVDKQHIIQHNYVRLYVGFLCQLACIIPIIVMGPTLIWIGLVATTYQCISNGKTHPLIITPLIFLLLAVPYWSVCWWISAWFYHIIYFMAQGMIFAGYVTHHAATWWKSRNATQQRKQQQQQQQQQQQHHQPPQQPQDSQHGEWNHMTSAPPTTTATTKTKSAAPLPEAVPVKTKMTSDPHTTLPSESETAPTLDSDNESKSTPSSPNMHVKENELKRRADGRLVDVDGNTQHEHHHPMHVSVAGEVEEMREPETPPVTHPVTSKPQTTVNHVSDIVSDMETLKITPSH